MRASWRWNLSGISVLQRNTGRFKESAGMAEKRRGDHPKEIQKKLIVIKTEDAIILGSTESYGIFSRIYASSILSAQRILDLRDLAGLKVIFTELPLSSPPVEELEAFSILQVTYTLS